MKKTKKTSRKVMSAARQLTKTTKKMVDDVFLKLVGMRVLERAQAMTQSLHQEKALTKKTKKAKKIQQKKKTPVAKKQVSRRKKAR